MIYVGCRVVWKGRLGTVRRLAFSRATEQQIAEVSFGPREVLRVPITEIEEYTPCVNS